MITAEIIVDVRYGKQDRNIMHPTQACLVGDCSLTTQTVLVTKRGYLNHHNRALTLQEAEISMDRPPIAGVVRRRLFLNNPMFHFKDYGEDGQNAYGEHHATYKALLEARSSNRYNHIYTYDAYWNPVPILVYEDPNGTMERWDTWSRKVKRFTPVLDMPLTLSSAEDLMKAYTQTQKGVTRDNAWSLALELQKESRWYRATHHHDKTLYVAYTYKQAAVQATSIPSIHCAKMEYADPTAHRCTVQATYQPGITPFWDLERNMMPLVADVLEGGTMNCNLLI